jgi:hypothetical protein
MIRRYTSLGLIAVSLLWSLFALVRDTYHFLVSLFLEHRFRAGTYELVDTTVVYHYTPLLTLLFWMPVLLFAVGAALSPNLLKRKWMIAGAVLIALHLILPHLYSRMLYSDLP